MDPISTKDKADLEAQFKDAATKLLQKLKTKHFSGTGTPLKAKSDIVKDESTVDAGAEKKEVGRLPRGCSRSAIKDRLRAHKRNDRSSTSAEEAMQNKRRKRLPREEGNDGRQDGFKKVFAKKKRVFSGRDDRANSFGEGKRRETDWKSKKADPDWKGKRGDAEWKEKRSDNEWKGKKSDTEWKGKRGDNEWKGKRGDADRKSRGGSGDRKGKRSGAPLKTRKNRGRS